MDTSSGCPESLLSAGQELARADVLRGYPAPGSVSEVLAVGVPATVEDVHATARTMPHVTVAREDGPNPVYQVGSKSFVYFRTPRPDAVDPVSGERYDDLILIWVTSELDKQALVADPSTPFFTTDHFDGHPSVLVQESRLHEVDREVIVELVQEAWLSQTSLRRANAWLAERGLPLLE